MLKRLTAGTAVALIIVAVAAGVAVEKGLLDFGGDDAPPSETTPTITLGSVRELVAGYERAGLSCSYEPEIVSGGQAIAVCKGAYGSSAVTIQVRGQRDARTFAFVTTTYLSGPKALDDARRWSQQSLLSVSRSPGTAGDAAEWVGDRAGTAGETTLEKWRLALRPRRSGLSLVLRGPWSPTPQPDFGPFQTSASVAERFAPILEYAARRDEPPKMRERFLPLAVDGYLRRAQLCRFRPVRVRRVPEGPVRTSLKRMPGCRRGVEFTELPTTRPRCIRCFWALDVRGAKEFDSASVYAARDRAMRASFAPPWTIYYAYRPLGPERWVLEYWMFYAFNDFKNVHEGDWEMIAIDLAVRRGTPRIFPAEITPRSIVYSAHHATLRRAWGELREGDQLRGDHPVVYVALGSHANYFEPDPPPTLEPIWKWDGRLRACVPVEDVANDFGPRLNPGDYDLRHLDDTVAPFVGGYGPANYIKWPDRIRIHKAGHPPTGDPRASWRWIDPLRLVTPGGQRCGGRR
jgi:hypothetical protein